MPEPRDADLRVEDLWPPDEGSIPKDDNLPAASDEGSAGGDGGGTPTQPKLEPWEPGHPRFQEKKEGAPPDPKQDPSRHEFWQSKADQRAAELEKERQEKEALLQELEKYRSGGNDPVGAAITTLARTNPQLAAELLTKGSVNDKSNELKAPAPPVKPERYDEVEAYNDPQSESFRYRREREDYRDAVLQYSLQRQEQMDAERREAAAREARDNAERNAIARVRNELASVHKLSPGQIHDFIEQMKDPKSASLENLVALWKIKNGQKPKPSNDTVLRNRNERDVDPPPVGAEGGGEGVHIENDEDTFNLSLAAASKGTGVRRL